VIVEMLTAALIKLRGESGLSIILVEQKAASPSNSPTVA